MTPDDRMGRCRAHSKQTGALCRQYAIPGGTVCRYHGGAAPQVKMAADERLKALEIPALVRLEQLMLQEEFPSVAIAAVKDALDRIRGKATESMQVNHSGTLTLGQLVEASLTPRHDS